MADSFKFSVPGSLKPAGAQDRAPEDALLGEFPLRTKYAVSVETPFRGAPVDSQLIDVNAADVIELELEGNVRQWIRASEYVKDLRQRPDGPIQLDPSAGLGQTRGLSDLVLKGLKVFGYDVEQEAAKMAAEVIVARLEDHLPNRPGLYVFEDPRQLPKESVTREALKTLLAEKPGQPLLVFLHGTASSSSGSFGELASSTEWSNLQEEYKHRIFALEHRTLSVSPIRNALDLVEALPEGAKLHLVSHSRGGLIGELLCLDSSLTQTGSALRDAVLEPFQKRGHAQNRADLERLLDQLGKIQVERFVRVASPTSGTLLADRRLDRYFTILLNLMGLIPALHASPIYSFVKAVAINLIHLKSDPSEIPGIEAMMPDSALVHALNDPELRSRSELAVIAGDVAGASGLGALKKLASIYYREKHDLVVNTGAMYTGLPRTDDNGAPKVRHFYWDRGPDVDHFHYFKNPKTRGRLWRGLKNGTPAEWDATFREIDRFELKIAEMDAGWRGVDKSPIVFFVPDWMGSPLESEDKPVWLDIQALRRRGLGQLDPARPLGVPQSPQWSPVYPDLLRFLSSTHEIRLFPYDWRSSVMTAGECLAGAVDKAMTEGRPVRFLAHGMGGLVVRAMIALRGEPWWKDLCARGGRAVLLGTPNAGTWTTVRIVAAQDPLVRMLALLDFGSKPETLAAMFARMPGLLEQLPSECLAGRWWEDNGIPAPDEGLLDAAGVVRAKLDRIGGDGLCYVAGSAAATPSGIAREDGELVFTASEAGDGRVLHESRKWGKSGAPAWYAPFAHGELADVRNRPRLRAALRDLLDAGCTEQLTQRPAEQPKPMPLRMEPVLFPQHEDLDAAALGYSAEGVPAQDLYTLSVRAVHGHLRHANYPVLVGHYAGDQLVSAEAILDQRLDGALQNRMSLGLYPGDKLTSDVVLKPEAQPPGALVIGLGELGEINREIVRNGVERVACEYALAVSERSPGTGPSTANISALLIGTNGGALDAGESVTAIVEGVLRANRLLQKQQFGERARIERLEFVEIYEDMAIQAARVVAELDTRLAGRLEAHERLVAAPRLEIRNGGRYYRPSNQYETGWWRRLRISTIEGGAAPGDGLRQGDLRFVMLTDRARNEKTDRKIDHAAVQAFLTKAMRAGQFDPQVSRTLFQLLVPPDLQIGSQEQADLLLMLDDGSARYPWELLSSSSLPGAEPLSVAASMIRQFETKASGPVLPSRASRALVIGDTEAGAPFEELPGAREEGRMVGTLLEGFGYSVTSLERPAFDRTLTALGAETGYRILHIASHGDFPESDERKCGAVLGGGVVLSADRIRDLRTVPDLVFLNCCHLGRMSDSPAKFAASLSRALIDRGVKAVVAAGWAIHDKAAHRFATEFYGAMLRGETFGVAVGKARRAAYREFPETGTWGAYQCYGSPDFVLAPGTGARSGSSPERFVVAREYLGAVRNISAEAGAAGSQRQAELVEQLTALWQDLPPEYRNGELLAEIAKGFAQLNDFGRAIPIFEQAINSPDATAPLKAVEQFVNRLARRAVQLPDSDAAKGELLKRAEEWVRWMDDRLAPSTERLSIIGSFFKRMAMTSAAEPAKRIEFVEKAREAYRRAHVLALKDKGLDTYPALNWATLALLPLLTGGELPAAERIVLDELLKQCEDAAKKVPASADFWSRVARPDCELLYCLFRGDLADSGAEEAEREVLRLYRLALGSGPSAGERDSVDGQFVFLLAMIPRERQTLRDTLERIRARIAAL